MINTIYIEQTVRDHERTNKILKRFSDARIISCDRYGEVFNPRSQNFRIQKQNPALIIAEKGCDEENIINKAIIEKNVKKYLENKKIIKKIYVKDRLLNLIIK